MLKKWFKLMWQNNYIQMFIFALILLVIVIIGREGFYSSKGLYVSIAIPLLIMSVTGYFGFYKFWKETKDKQ